MRSVSWGGPKHRRREGSCLQLGRIDAATGHVGRGRGRRCRMFTRIAELRPEVEMSCCVAPTLRETEREPAVALEMRGSSHAALAVLLLELLGWMSACPAHCGSALPWSQQCNVNACSACAQCDDIDSARPRAQQKPPACEPSVTALKD